MECIHAVRPGNILLRKRKTSDTHRPPFLLSLLQADPLVQRRNAPNQGVLLGLRGEGPRCEEGGNRVRILSLGVGVQSSCLALMAKNRDIEPPDCAIFADTGWEPKSVYDYLWYLVGELNFPVYIVSSGNLRSDVLHQVNRQGAKYLSIPVFTLDANGKASMKQRQCTSNYKIEPINKEVRRLLGYRPRQRIPAGSAEMLIGISTDEATRMKPARNPWQNNVYPLIDLNMSRSDCQSYIEKHGYRIPAKSSCLGCPFHNDADWKRIKSESPEEWDDTLMIDDAIRKSPIVDATQFLYRKRIPLRDADFDTKSPQLDFFQQECEGMCGV
jgi:3'-phosphoadenosine 5'-phosphosulfate sulfotransferase (PAPS reductase)/FAD synthetase